jgi:hypothetical protein
MPDPTMSLTDALGSATIDMSKRRHPAGEQA